MYANSLPLHCTVAAGCGLLAHLLYFIHGEKDGKALRIIIAHLNAEVLLSAYLIRYLGISKQYLSFNTAINLSYFGALFFSIVAYRLAFHRLRHFPGPLGAKLTKAYGLWMARNVKYIDELCKLHQTYGDVVRVGPNELSIRNVETLLAVNGPGSKCTKGTFYEPLSEQGEYALAVTRDKAHHKQRRQVWEKAFNSKSLKAYEPRVKSSVDDLLSQIAAHEGKPMEVSHWALLFVFDVMGKVGFSEDWGAVKDGRPNPILHLLEALFTPLGRLGRWIWPIGFFVDTGLGNEDREAFEAWSNKLLAVRQKEGREGSIDIATFLIESFHEAPNFKAGLHNQNLLNGEGQPVMIAATDTVSNSISWVFYHVARSASLQREIYQAIKPLFTQGDEAITHISLSQIPLLDAVINEAMRLHSSATVGGSRMTPSEGLQVGDLYIPGDVNVYIPPHALHLDERYFERATEFLPERWMTAPKLIKDKRAFAPFTIGTYNCVGRQLALMELRYLLAYTVWNYEFAYAPGENGRRMEEESLDLVIMKAGKLDVVFKKRESVGL
ncbi:cytochrome P450 [Hyaloscypha variabilis F]|uniref:Cytochrome P450 n=1 Tax=Hyaloscypha variabilis (strain UAMH 11265 / GT02V1 / F) TaxID=1149755 RepID=A0A2J6R492_HYAVF|nr:cytochrome P450 [Hyaloscypha variabilis F]